MGLLFVSLWRGCSLEPVDDGDVDHGAKPRLSTNDTLDAVDDDCRGRDVAVDTTTDGGTDVGSALEDHRVMRMLQTVVCAQLKSDDGLTVHVAMCSLLDTAALACRDLQEGTADIVSCNDRVDCLISAVKLPAKRTSDEVDRLGEADVTDLALVAEQDPLVHVEASTDLLLEGETADPRVLVPLHADGLHLTAETAHQHRQHVHQEARIDSSAQNNDVVLLCKSVNLRREARMAGKREGQLLA